MHWQVEALLARRMRTLRRASLILCWSLVIRKDSQSRTQLSYLWLRRIAKDVPVLGRPDLEGHGWEFLRA